MVEGIEREGLRAAVYDKVPVVILMVVTAVMMITVESATKPTRACMPRCRRTPRSLWCRSWWIMSGAGAVMEW